MMQIEVHLNPPADAAAILSREIANINYAAIPGLEPNEAEIKFHVLAMDETDSLTGGLRASCYWNTLHIELLWLSQAVRGTGAGTKLVQQAERFAFENGCEKAFVETTSWQARPFYERLGYRLLGTLEGRPKGHATHYLTKSLGKPQG